MQTAKRYLGIGVLIGVLFTSSCSDPTLNQIAKFEADLNTACTGTFTVIAAAAAAQPPLISIADAGSIIAVLVKIEMGNAQAVMATQQIQKLSVGGQANLLTIFQPIQTAVSNTVQNGTLGIKDPDTKAKVQLGLTTLQTILGAGVLLIHNAKTTP